MHSGNKIMVHGHRGWRGAFPENSIRGFIEAICIGVHALELDVVIDADDEIIVSHDPYMHHEICVKPDGSVITPDEEKALNIYRMHREERLLYNLPAPIHPRFPEQMKNISSLKPTLQEVVRGVRDFCSASGFQMPLWNIEIKSQPDWDDVFHPTPDVYAARFLEKISELGIEENCIIQSFDLRILRELYYINPHLKLVALEDRALVSIDHLIECLGFIPFGFSPNFSLVSKEIVESSRAKGIELLVWTVNEETDLKRMLDMGVRHIITDFPDRALAYVHSLS